MKYNKNKTPKEKNELAYGVKVLNCGSYGYQFLNKKVIFKSKDLKKVNDFSMFCNSEWVKQSSNMIKTIENEAEKRQKLETDFFNPPVLPNAKGEKIISRGHNYESVLKEKI